MSSSTVGNCVSRAVEIAQLDSSFLPLARQYYNLVVSDLTISWNWPFYRVQDVDIVMIPGVTVYPLPTDWSRSDTCYTIDTNNNRKECPIISKYRFDRLQRPDNQVGDPRMCFTDLTNHKLHFDASPSATRTYRLTYFRKAIEVDESGANDADEVDAESPMYMIYKIAAMLMDYRDDERAPNFDQEAEKILAKNKMFSYDEDNDSRVELGISFRPGRRPTRSGGGGFFSF